jgi:hypothetical protein
LTISIIEVSANNNTAGKVATAKFTYYPPTPL